MISGGAEAASANPQERPTSPPPRQGRLAASTVREARQLIEGFEKYPDIDLFKEFP
jgi:hypothetical protein